MNNEIIDGFNAVEFMRRERDQISHDIEDMNFVELQKYFKERRTRLTRINFQQNSHAVPNEDTHV
jgi:hypothetical protein